MLASFAVVAIVLASVGLYGLLAFFVSQRTREIGLRLALGATPRSIVGTVARRGLTLALIGIGIGAAMAYGAGQWMESLLAGVSPHDVRVFAAAASTTFVLAIAGTLLPAIRAARVSPLVATKTE